MTGGVTPSGSGSRPTGQAPSGLAGIAASIPNAKPFQGSAGDAIDYALGHIATSAAAMTFLDQWREDCALEWDGYAKWLEVQYRERSSALTRMVALDEELGLYDDEPIYCEPMPPIDPEGWCEWVHPLPGYLMKCCDCGLVHDVQFQIVQRSENAELNPGEDDDHVVIFRMRRHAQGGVTEGRDGEAGSGPEGTSTRSSEAGCALSPSNPSSPTTTKRG